MPEPARTSPEDPAALLRFVTFRVGDARYALPADEVSEIVHLPGVARVPQGPRALLGLANLRGAAVPVASVRGLLGLRQDSATAVRAIVMDDGAPVALAVDAVDSLVSIPAERVEERHMELGAQAFEQLKGLFSSGTNGQVTKILDMEKLLSAAFARRAQADARAHRMRALHDQANETPVQVQRFVTFEVAAQEYGLEIGVVREIVPAPDHLAQVPGADAAVLGIVGLRDTLLPLLSLRALLGQPPSPQDARGAKVVVTSVGETTIGLVVDAMRAIVSADASQVEAVPELLAARSGGEARIKAIYRGEEGRRLIPILSPEHLFRDETMRRLTEQRASAPTPAVAAHEGERQQAQFLVFRLGEDVYGLPLAAVDEVARVPEQITRLPKAPKFLEGVINLRGDVLPVIDQRRRFDMPALEHGRQRHLIVVRSDRHRAGLIVDEVSEVLRTASARLAPPPALSEDTSRLVHGVVALEQERMLIVLDPAELLTRAERGLLDAFQVETEQAPL